MRCIFDEEDEIVQLCQILVPLVPKMYKETDRRCYGSKKTTKREAEKEKMGDMVKEEGDRRRRKRRGGRRRMNHG